MSKNIPEERVPGILARAAELDRQTISIDALRAAAIEAGISADALDQAISEYEAGVAPVMFPGDVAPQPRARGWRRWLRRVAEPLKFGALALVLGLIGAGDTGLATVAICWLIGTAGYLAWRDRGVRNAARFQVNAVVMTGLMFFGLAGAGGDEDAIGFLVLFGLALLVLGTLIVHFGGEREEQGEAAAR